ncbi:MAG: hypothetical protein ACRDJ9_30485 [Dehalococcoidia bacterium]
MNQFGVTKPGVARRRALEGTAHAPTKPRTADERHKTAHSELTHLAKTSKDKRYKRALDVLNEPDGESETSVKAMALRRV